METEKQRTGGGLHDVRFFLDSAVPSFHLPVLQSVLTVTAAAEVWVVSVEATERLTTRSRESVAAELVDGGRLLFLLRCLHSNVWFDV